MTVSYGGSIVTSGLTMMLDAANTRSYPGSGTAWNDISGNGNTGTLRSSPTYSSNNLGYFSFNGSSQYVSIPISSTFALTGNNFTIDIWFNLTAYLSSYNGGYAGMIFATTNTLLANGGNYGFQVGLFGTASSYTSVFLYANNGALNTGNIAQAFSLNTWYNITLTHTAAGAFVIYLNGTQFTTLTNATTWTDNSPASIAYNPQTGYNDYLPAKIGNFKFYNQVLSAAQVAQNFVAYRGRYGV